MTTAQTVFRLLKIPAEQYGLPIDRLMILLAIQEKADQKRCQPV
jgi:hypothetical protein